CWVIWVRCSARVDDLAGQALGRKIHTKMIEATTEDLPSGVVGVFTPEVLVIGKIRIVVVVCDYVIHCPELAHRYHALIIGKITAHFPRIEPDLYMQRAAWQVHVVNVG